MSELAISLPLFLVAVMVFILSWILGRFISWRRNLYRRIEPNYFIANLLGQIRHLFFILLGLVLVLSLLDLTALLGTILGAAGILGLAIGFAVRDTVEKYIASILLSLCDPFEVNDLVSIDGNEGNVVRMTSRATILMSLDGNHIRIPNSTEGVLSDPKPLALINELGDFNVVMRIYFWVDQASYNALIVHSEIIRKIKEAFDQANIEMPEPVYQVRMISETSKDLSQKNNISQDSS